MYACLSTQRPPSSATHPYALSRTMFTPTLLALSSLSGLALASPFLAPTSPAPELFNTLISSGCSTTGTESCHNTTKVANVRPLSLCVANVADPCNRRAASKRTVSSSRFSSGTPTLSPALPTPGRSTACVQLSMVRAPLTQRSFQLWPNYCTSSYPQNCDTSRAYTDISGLLTAQGASSTLSYMNVSRFCKLLVTLPNTCFCCRRTGRTRATLTRSCGSTSASSHGTPSPHRLTRSQVGEAWDVHDHAADEVPSFR
jgi:hypothetical protein